MFELSIIILDLLFSIMLVILSKKILNEFGLVLQIPIRKKTKEEIQSELLQAKKQINSEKRRLEQGEN